MVVIQSKASASTTPSALRKNRRRVTRKTPRRANAAGTIPDHSGLSTTDGQDTETPSKTDRPTATIAEDDDELMIDADAPPVPHTGSAPAFPPLPASALRTGLKSETRRIPIPPHRMTPLKKDWVSIFGPLTEILGLQVRMNVPRRCVEARVSLYTRSSALKILTSPLADIKAYEGYWRPPERCRFCQGLCPRLRCQCNEFFHVSRVAFPHPKLSFFRTQLRYSDLTISISTLSRSKTSRHYTVTIYPGRSVR